MIEHTVTDHQLQLRKDRGGDDWTIWQEPVSDIYKEARRLARFGRVAEAIDEAFDAAANIGFDLHHIDFRVVTKTVTVTLEAGEVTPERTRTY